MVLDNNVASISVGQQVPINSGSTITDGGNTINNISYRDTGVHLTVRPSVNAGGLVTLDVDQQISDVGEIDPATDNLFFDRTISSRVAVRSESPWYWVG